MKASGENLRQYTLIVVVHLAVVIAWHFWVVLGEVPSYVMPTPLDALRSLGNDYNWMHNTLITASEVFGGYLLAVVVGVGLAMLFSWFKVMDGLGPNIVIAFSICFLPILLTTTRGLQEVDPDLVDLVRTLRATRWQVFSKIQLPGALPYVFSGMKVAVVLAVAGAIVGEFIASEEGLGYLMLQVQVTLDTAAMFMAVVLITIVGVLLYSLVLILEYLLVARDARVE